MSWQSRLQEAAYTPPSGKRLTFQYEDVALEFEKKGTAFEFSDANNTYVQQTGNTSRKYPLRCIFWGTNYDIESNAFLQALEENGIGKLEHPIYGTTNVVPLGTIRRRDDLKTAANQSILEITFFNTIGAIYPSSQDDAGNLVLSSIDEYNTSAANSFPDTLDLSSETKKAGFKGTFQSVLSSTQSGLDSIASTSKEVETEFNAINDSINSSINILVDNPTTLAFQTIQLIQSPSRAAASLKDKLSGYKNLINSLIGKNAKNKNEYGNNNLYIKTYITGSINSSVNNQFETKKDALETAEEILQQLEDVTNWSDTQLESLNEIDTGESYQQLQEAVALTAGFLVEISFTLKSEKSIVLDRDRTIIDLVAELYGEVDNQLDFLINSNNLTGDEILELPKGKEIFYYV